MNAHEKDIDVDGEFPMILFRQILPTPNFLNLQTHTFLNFQRYPSFKK